MSYDENKELVLNFFNEHINKYIVKDLEVLNSIEADSYGNGGCAIPQAISTFAALDLIGYLIHDKDLKVVYMSFSDLLKNDKYFPDFQIFISQDRFLDLFRESIRNIMVHRFSLVNYHIQKSDDDLLFVTLNGNEIFNVSVFTKNVIKAINNIYKDICGDNFIINGYDHKESIEKMKDRIENLKKYDGSGHEPINNLPTPRTTPQTTPPIS